MADFVKIFLSICALVAVFIFGRNYGEKTYRDSEEYRSIVKANEELNFAKNELENIKVKFQNITDGGENKKTEELLAQILQVFLADLGLQIQNKEALLKKAEVSAPLAPVAQLKTSPPVTAEAVKETTPQPPTKATTEAWSKSKVNRFKSFEWMTVNSSGDQGTLQDLKKVQIKNLNGYLSSADYLDRSDCASFLGVYKGSVKNINKSYFGSLVFEFRAGVVEDKAGFYGKITFYNEANKMALSEKIENNCGRKIKGLSGRIFNLTSDKYIQIYKLVNVEKIAGNFYQVLPNGTTTLVGPFVLNRTDKF